MKQLQAINSGCQLKYIILLDLTKRAPGSCRVKWNEYKSPAARVDVQQLFFTCCAVINSIGLGREQLVQRTIKTMEIVGLN